MSSENLDTRRRILNSAWKLLEFNQGKGVRIADIAREAGVSRQAVYLHFPTRSELLIATTRYIDEANDVDDRLAASRSAVSGVERLDAFIVAWGNYIPVIYPVWKALLTIKDTDAAAAAAIEDRDQAVRHGCHAAVQALKKDGVLLPDYSFKEATDILWTLLSVRAWERFSDECGWSQVRYVKTMKTLAKRILIMDGSSH